MLNEKDVARLEDHRQLLGLVETAEKKAREMYQGGVKLLDRTVQSLRLIERDVTERIRMYEALAKKPATPPPPPPAPETPAETPETPAETPETSASETPETTEAATPETPATAPSVKPGKRAKGN